jgi:hypothetical protein
MKTLVINDLAAAVKELGADEMSAVRGGNGVRFADDFCGTVPKHLPFKVPGFPFPPRVVPEVPGEIVRIL